MASVLAPAGCAWEAIPGGSWLTVSPPSSGVGPGTVSVTTGSNAMSLNSRLATVNAGAAVLTVTQSAGSCSAPQFYPATQTIPVAGGTGSVAVALPAGCSITAASTTSWITINSGATGSGDDLVTFTVAANSGGARSGTITIAGAGYTVTQLGALCVTSLTPSGTSVGPAGGSLTASLVAPTGCTWTVASNANWLTVNPSGGNGSTTLALTVVANATAAARSVTIAIQGLSFSIMQAAAMPSFVSLTPSAGSGSSQVFTALFSDTAGGSAISGELFLINSTLNGGSACWVQVGSSGIYLYDDDSTPVVLGPIVAGATYSNKQCTLNGSGSGVSISGNNLTLTLSITFKSAFSGSKNIYAFANDVYGNSTGWQTVGTFTTKTAIAVSVTPNAGTGSSQVFSAVFSDTAGGSALSGELFLINSTLNGSSACWVQVGSSGIYLYDDDSTPVVLGPIVAGATYSNKQCTLNGSGSGVSTSGNNLTLTLSITFKGAFSGPKNIYTLANDVYGSSTGWQTVGSFTVGSAMPSFVSVTPNAGSGSSEVFTAVFSDTAGGSAINGEFFLINSTLNGSGACWIQVGPSGIYLYDDDSTPVVLGPIVAGGTYSNKQCTLNGTGSGVSTSGNNLTLTLSITFKGAFSGLKNIYALANDVYGNSTGWQTVGTFTLGSAMPSFVSLTPNAGSGSSQVFTAVFSDTAGGSAISGGSFLINSTLNGSSACWIQVGPSGIYLYDDDSTPVVLGPIVAGGTYSNKQCTLNGTGSAVSTSENNLTLTLFITFNGVFSGPKNIYALANDVYGNSTGWQTVGSFTP